MSAGENTLARLQRLQADGSLARSACSRTLIQRLGPLLSAGVVVEERSGAGRRLVVRQTAALAAFLQREFPAAALAPEDYSRTAGVARFRDSKAFASDTPEIVCARAWSEEALHQNGKSCGAAAATTAHGIFAFLLSQTRDYSLHAPTALVENPALFAQFERLRLPVSLAIYGRGRASTRLVEWLGDQSSPGFSLLHLPDFDPTGLAEYERLHARLGARISLFLPPDLEERFQRFSNRSLLHKPNTQAMLASLQQSPLPEVRQIVALINRHNAGLEQEALLLG
jgi:hypothetical protein